MSDKHIKIEKMWWGKKQPPVSLKMMSYLYRLINQLNLTARKRRCVAPPIPMISVGNLTAGGSGKTPFVIWLSGLLKQDGYRPVLICRGDGGKSREPHLVNDGSDPLIVGDEAVLLYQSSGCPVIAGRDRVRAAYMAAEYGDLIILDDGFQYRQLDRACDLVLIPAEGIGNGHLIPAGPLREPIEALERADMVIRTGECDTIEPLSSGREWRWWSHEFQLTQITGPKSEIPTHAVASTAIARPERFLRSLDKLNIRIEEKHLFPDHHPFTQSDIAQISNSDLPVIVTAKDAVKLKRIWPANRQLWVLEQSSVAEPGLFEAIKEKIS